MNRGEVWWVRFDPAVGGEIRKRRPAVILSNDRSNRFLNRVQVVPLTSKTDRVYSSEALVTFRNRSKQGDRKPACHRQQAAPLEQGWSTFR